MIWWVSAVAIVGVGCGLWFRRQSRRHRARRGAQAMDPAPGEERRSLERLQHLADHMTEVSWTATADWSRITYVSRAFETIWGRGVADVLAEVNVWLGAVHPDDRARVRQTIALNQTSDAEQHVEYRIVRPDGSVRWISSRSRAIRAANGQVREVAGFAADITVGMETGQALRESEEQFRQLADNIPEVFWLRTADQKKTLYVSPAYERITGRSCASFYADTDAWKKSVHPDDLPRVLAATKRRDREWLHEDIRYRLVQPSGAVRWIWNRTFPIRDRAGEVIRVAGLSVDVTDQHLLEDELRRATRHYRLLSEAIQDVVSLLDNEGRPVYISPSYEKLSGYTIAEALHTSFFPRVHPDDRERIAAALARNLAGETLCVEWRILRKDGAHIWVETVANPVGIEGQGVTHVLCCTRDISQRKEAEALIRHGEERYRLLAQNIEDVVCLLDPTGRVLYVSPSVEPLLGVAPAKLRHEELAAFAHADDRSLLSATRERNLAGEPARVEWRCRRHDGSFVWLESTTRRIDDDLGQPMSVICCSRNITERKRSEETLRDAEEHLRQSEARHRAILSAAADGIVTFDDRGLIDSVNAAAQRMFGYGQRDMHGAPIGKLVPAIAEPTRLFGAAAEPGAAPATPLPHLSVVGRRQDGAELPLEITVSPVPQPDRMLFACVLRDVTERNRLESQLRQAQKMESLGTLAAGIAHEFNNILTPIQGFVELLQTQVAQDDAVQTNLGYILGAAERGRDLVQRIRAFSRQSAPERLPLLLSSVIEESVPLLRSTLPATIDIHTHLDARTAVVEADATQIHQVVMNLGTNAAHALRERAGIIEFRSYFCHPEDVPVSMPPARYVVFSVQDTGHGIPPRVLDRIFEPFFTTKSREQGTGMGLAVVHGIVEGHGGVIRVRSRVGVGTTFDIFLPCLENTAPIARPTHDGAVLPGGDERILFVDDEPAICKLGKELFEQLGYRVVAVESSPEALGHFRADPAGFDLLMTDQTMPQMTGAELAGEALKLRPDLPVILTTGFNDAIDIDHLPDGNISVLLKPFRMLRLAEAVRSALSGVPVSAVAR